MSNTRIKEDLTNKVFNHWLVVKELGGGKIICRCIMCNKTEKELYKKVVKSGQTTMCKDCSNNFAGKKLDLIGKTFGHLKVVRPVGNGMQECVCINCNSTTHVSRANLISGRVQNCRCLQGEHLKDTMKKLYGDIASQKINTPREEWQIEMLHNYDKLRDYIINLGFKPTIRQICEKLGVNDSTALLHVHNAKLEDIIDIQPTRSQYEEQIIQYIYEIKPNIILELNTRKVLEGKELDIFIPELRLAIEFNGNYWHSSINKKSKYHQEKSLECMSKNIHLIHIFEYEWRNEFTREKIKNYIKYIILEPTQVYARNTIIKEIDTRTEKEFINQYHLQNYVASNIAFGLFADNELISVMSFGKPRFSDECDYELLRYCTKAGIKVIGGAQKLLQYFLRNNEVNSIVTYANISKFKGNIYTKLGFTACKGITSPGYVWVEPNSQEVLSRYKCQKNILKMKGIDTEGQTEDEIMSNLGYLKIYDSGNLKFQYRKEG